MKIVKRFLAEIVDWVVFYPLFKTGTIERVDVFTFQNQDFEVFTSRTRLFSKRLYTVLRTQEIEDRDWRDPLVQNGVIVTVKNLGNCSVEELRQAHPALKNFDLSSDFQYQF